jgi:hypothetical protein
MSYAIINIFNFALEEAFVSCKLERNIQSPYLDARRKM